MDDSGQSSRAPDADDPVPLKKVRIEATEPPRCSSTEADNGIFLNILAIISNERLAKPISGF